MCDFPYLAVVLREGFEEPRLAEYVEAFAVKHWLRTLPLHPADGSFVDRVLGERAAAVVSFRVGHCACGWPEASHRSLSALARDLLGGRDVLRVRFGVWWIRGAVDDGDPHGAFEKAPHDLGTLPPSPPRPPYLVELRRPDAGPHPRARLSTIARAI